MPLLKNPSIFLRILRKYSKTVKLNLSKPVIHVFFSLFLIPLSLAHSLDLKIIFFWTQRVWQCLTKILPDPHLIAGTTPDFRDLHLDVPFVLQGGLQYPLHFAVLPPIVFLKTSFLTQIV